MTPHEFCAKYGKMIGKRILEIAYEGNLEELISDLQSLSYEASESAGKYVIVPYPSDAAELHSKHSGLHIIVLGEVVKPYKNITIDDLNTAPIEKYDGKFLVIVNDSPEGHLTVEGLKAKYPHKNIESAPYGLSATNPFKTDEYTQRKILKHYYVEG